MLLEERVRGRRMVGPHVSLLAVLLFLTTSIVVSLKKEESPSSSSTAVSIHRHLIIPASFWASLFCVSRFLTGCVCTEDELREATSRAEQQVELCRGAHIEINDVLDISGKSLSIKCPDNGFFVTTNECLLDGQGITRIFQGTAATLKLDNINLINGFRPNSGTDLDGGAIHLVDSNLVIRDSTLRDNEAMGGAGGAIFASNTIMNLINCQVQNNIAGTAAAIALINSQSSVQDSTIEQNSGRDGSSIGINGGSAGFSNVNFFDNVASSSLGAALAVSVAKVSIALCTFSGNQAVQFPDILVLDDQNPALGGTRVDCTNNAFCDGIGGINEVPSLSGTDVFDNLCNNPGFAGTPGQSPCP